MRFTAPPPWRHHSTCSAHGRHRHDLYNPARNGRGDPPHQRRQTRRGDRAYPKAASSGQPLRSRRTPARQPSSTPNTRRSTRPHSRLRPVWRLDLGPVCAKLCGGSRPRPGQLALISGQASRRGLLPIRCRRAPHSRWRPMPTRPEHATTSFTFPARPTPSIFLSSSCCTDAPSRRTISPPGRA